MKKSTKLWRGKMWLSGKENCDECSVKYLHERRTIHHSWLATPVDHFSQQEKKKERGKMRERKRKKVNVREIKFELAIEKWRESKGNGCTPCFPVQTLQTPSSSLPLLPLCLLLVIQNLFLSYALVYYFLLPSLSLFLSLSLLCVH